MLPSQVVDEVESLRKTGYTVELIEAEGWANIVFEDHPLPAGYNKATTQLLLRFPLSYPNGQPDMFWTDADLTLASGGIPQNGDQIEIYLERQWRRFSWHPSSWRPGSDDLRTYLEFVNSRLERGI